ncbi:DoxX family membrane protein [Streptomyces pratensis]|uniref:DoxX family membrane protein n=1 Tax=Streptomyces pratensis TaxID=1169025 RepID=UPI00363A121D
MSVDTRTPRFDDQPALSMTKVDSDPAQVIVSHASFRVQLAPGQRTRLRPVGSAGPARIPAMSGAGGRRRAPVVWSGRSEPGDPGATGLLQAVRNSTAGHLDVRPGGDFGAGYDDTGGGTQVIPRLDETQPNPVLRPPHQGGPRTGPLLPPMRQAVGAYDAVETPRHDAYDVPYDDDPDAEGQDGTSAGERRHANDAVRHAYYPGRRMNLGVVLLPLRVILGFLSIYAGMGKLCDPAYFDGGDRGSMVKWLTSLHPWTAAEPLRDLALSHPVAAGLSVAFLQVVVGVLTVLGLWQRVAAAFAVLLSAAILVTVSWRSAAYDTPDIILLAAWSPLVIAGAPVYSLDGRLAGEAWRTLGPRSAIWDLRRRVLRRGTVVATVVVGLTLLVGSMLGGAVRSTEVVTVPDPDSYPTNQLPGAPLPDESTGKKRKPSRTPENRTPETSPSSAPGTPSAEESTQGSDSERESGPTAGASTGGEPSQTQGTGQVPPQEPSPQEPPSGDAGPSSSGSAGSGGTTGGSDDGGSSGGGSEGGSSGGAGQNPIGGLLG